MPQARNVLFVLCDQLRRTALSHAGDPNVETPAIDSLAADGARCTAACSTYPACVPTRATFVTGRSAHAFNAFGHDFRLSPAERTIGDAFRDCGYWTGYAGKWHLHGAMGLENTKPAHRSPIPPAHHGFEHWRGFEFRNDPYDTVYFADDDLEPRSMDGHQTDELTDIGCRLLDRAAGDERPFFLTLSYEAPHPPHVAPDSSYGRWRNVDLTLPPDVAAAVERGAPPGPIFGPDGSRTYDAVGDPAGSDTLGEGEPPDYHRSVFLDDVRAYYAMVEHLDANVQRLLDRLEDRGVRAETRIVFTADHGELLGRHGAMRKRLPNEAAAGVPFLVSGPGIPSADHSNPIQTEDWYPTLLGLAGADEEPDGPGADLTPLLTGSADGLSRPGIHLEHVEPQGGNGPWRAYRTEQFKYAVRDGEPWQLFDLDADPLELDNLIENPDHAETATRLHGLLRSHLASSTDTYRLAPAFGHEALHA